MQKKKGLTREQARALYDDLHRAMTQVVGKGGGIPAAAKSTGTADPKVAKEIADAIRAGLNDKGSKPSQTLNTFKPLSSKRPRPAMGKTNSQVVAILVLVGLGFVKTTLDIIEGLGAQTVATAQASMAPLPAPQAGTNWSKEQVKVLTSLDGRRVELDERSDRLDERENDLNSRDREIAARLSELKDLTDKLKGERDKGDKQRSAQMDQLANVYGSMNPPEAAQLLSQLDVSVALSLIERMPEKRIGQILALMSQEKALAITNMLSQRQRN